MVSKKDVDPATLRLLSREARTRSLSLVCEGQGDRAQRKSRRSSPPAIASLRHSLNPPPLFHHPFYTLPNLRLVPAFQSWLPSLPLPSLRPAVEQQRPV
mmetsp:Transcript_1086/g.2264  ORF Transcript_1086/g.2264 Transcript_1086/m.2264 type:complete len:99 (+) Transcript_1086:1502-1798(+)